MAQYANAVITKVRAMYGRMLSPVQYDELLRRQSVSEISAYLKDKTVYATALAGVQDSTVHRGQLENLLHRDTFYQYARLVRYAGSDTGIYRCTVMDLEIEQILACLRGIISPRQDSLLADIPTFVQPYACFNLLGLVGIGSVSALVKALAGSPYAEIVRRCMETSSHEGEDERPNYTAYEVALRTWYFSTLVKSAEQAKGKARVELLKLINTRAETMNINTIYRMKTYFRGNPGQIRQAILPFYGGIRRKALDAMIDAPDAAAFMALLSKSCYRRSIDPGAAFIEGQTDNIRFHLDLKMLRFSTDPRVVFTAFILLRGMETENIIRIIEGVRYQLAPERIEKLLYRT